MIKRYFVLILIVLIGTGIMNAQSGWFNLNSGTTLNLNNVFFVDENNGYVIGENGIILKTTDGGSNWEIKSPGNTQTLNGIYFNDVNHGVIVGNFGIVLKTTDGGNSWSTPITGITDDLLSVSFNGNYGIAGGTSQTIIYSTDAGDSWTISQSGFFGGGFWGVQMLDADNAFVAGENSIFQPLFGNSTNSGQNWNFTAFYLNSNEGRLYDVHFFDVNNGITSASVFTGEGAISKTTDGGANWTTAPFFSNVLYAINFPVAQTGYSVGAAGIIIKTSNGGASWEIQNSMTSNNLLGVSFADAFTGYAVGEGGTILKTTSGGVVPVELSGFNAILDESNVKLSWETATETNNNGFFVQRKAGSVWENLNFVQGYGTSTESHSYEYTDNLAELNYRGKIYYRLKQIDYNGATDYSSPVEVTYEPKPNDFALDQNYPNPFNPTTSIKYSLPEETHVKLTIYDLLGNEVKVLVDENKPAGTYTAKFNGSELTSGIYIYRLQAGDFVSTKRMALIK